MTDEAQICEREGYGALARHAERDDLAAAMAALYEDVDAAVAACKPTCWSRGACCRFRSFGHRLYVTDLEIAYFVRGARAAWRPAADDAACPYQIDGMCTTRVHRPLGCRIYFCDETAQAWQGATYERFLRRLKEMGRQFSVPYRYREWLSALREQDESMWDSAQSSRPIPTVDAVDAARPAPNGVDALSLPVIQ